jgi:hypothetical protein
MHLHSAPMTAHATARNSRRHVCDLDNRENDLPDFRAVGRVDHPWVHGWPERFHLSEDRFTDELASALAAARGIEFCQELGVDGEGNQFLTFCADVWHGFGI